MNNAIISLLGCTKRLAKPEKELTKCLLILQNSLLEQTGIYKDHKLAITNSFFAASPKTIQSILYFVDFDRSRMELQELKDESFRVEQAVEAEETSPTCGNC